MDIFKFVNPTHPLKMEQGEIINGLTSKTWIERYGEAGEFELVAPASSNIKSKLPEGSFISHVNSTDLMIVENHEIRDDKDKEAEIVVTGRGFESYLEQRIIGSNKMFPTSTGVTDYTLGYDFISTQVKNMIKTHISTVYLIDDNNYLPYVEVTEIVDGTEVAEERSLQQQDLYSAVIELLKEGNLGIKVYRPGAWSPALTPENIAMLIHKGVDRSKSVSFSYDTGEIESADYFWSNRKNKNCALVQGRWVETTVMIGAPVGYDRRWMIVDASDIDQQYTEPPTGGTLSSIVAKMQSRGKTELGKQKNIALTKAEVSKQSVKALYRTDYDLGDLISVEGNYNEESVQRVTEYVEIEDSTGRSSYPTLSDPE